MKKLEDNDIWILIPYPNDDFQILPGKWVYDLKSDPDSTVIEFYARWVVCGNYQAKSGESIWASIASDISVKIFLTHYAKNDLVIYQTDSIGAYLHALLQHRRILIAQPTGLEKKRGHVCLLQKTLYRLQESANL